MVAALPKQTCFPRVSGSWQDHLEGDTELHAYLTPAPSEITSCHAAAVPALHSGTVEYTTHGPEFLILRLKAA